jgi:putative transposase
MLAILTLILDIFRLGFQLFRPNGKSSLMAECILLRQQLLLVKRKQSRAPNLTTLNRIVFAITIPFIKSTRLPRLSIVIAHSTLLRIHKALVERKYSMLFSNKNRKPGPKGPSPELIKLIIGIKQKNPKYGCPRIALLASKLTDRTINENLVRRILRQHFLFPSGSSCQSWLSQIGKAKDDLWSMDLFRCESILLKTHWVMIVMDQYTRRIIGVAVHAGDLDGPAICKMFPFIRPSDLAPKHLSTDHDPLFQYLRWKANLRVLEIDEIKTVPEVPRSHPFIERLIGTVRREYLDTQLFWGEVDLQRRLESFTEYYSSARVHYSLQGQTPNEKSGKGGIMHINLNDYRWQTYCNKNLSIPIAA